MIATGFAIVLSPPLSFYQQAFSIGMFIIGSGFILAFILRNPAILLKEYINEYARIQIVLSSHQLEQETYRREIEKVQGQTTVADPAQLAGYFKHLQESTETAVKNIQRQDPWLP
jgi:hypothetical protein